MGNHGRLYVALGRHTGAPMGEVWETPEGAERVAVWYAGSVVLYCAETREVVYS